MQTLTDLLAAEVQTRTAHCHMHGSYVSKQFLGSIWSKCPECAKEADHAEREAKQKAEQERRVRAWQQRLGHAGIPERFTSRTLDTYQASNDGQRKALAFARAYADDFGKVLETGRSALLVGKPGTGKTHLAVGIALQIMAAGHTALFTTTFRAIRRIKDTWSKVAEETEAQATNALVFPSLLVLDEVGVQFGSEAEKLILFDVLNERYEQRLPTIMLSNLTSDAIKGYLGERIFDRLREDGGQLIVFDWESARGRITAGADTAPTAPPSFDGRPTTGNPLFDGCE